MKAKVKLEKKKSLMNKI